MTSELFKRPGFNPEKPGLLHQVEGKVFARFHAAVLHAVKVGDLKVCPCEICGKEGIEILSNGAIRRTIVAHHDDYNKPLNVRWLCRTHHTQWHRENYAIRPAVEITKMSAEDLYFHSLNILRNGT